MLALHERLLAEHGGAPGILSEAMLDAALARPKNHFADQCTDVFRLAAVHACVFTRNHPFTDGNNPAALTVAGVFLELNSYRLEASERDAAMAMRALSSREMGEREFADWLRLCSSRTCTTHRRPAVKAETARRKQAKKR